MTMPNLKTVTFYLKKNHPDFKLALLQVEETKIIRNAVIFITRQKQFRYKGSRWAKEILEEEYDICESELDSLSLSPGSLEKLARRVHISLGLTNISASCAYAIGKRVSYEWKTYFGLIKAYKAKRVSVFPKLPGYSKRYATLPVPRRSLNQNKVKYLSKVGLADWKSRFSLPEAYKNVYAARLQAINSSRLKFSVVYIDEEPVSNYKGSDVAGLDFGLENLFTVALTSKDSSFIVSGKPLKSINHKYNKDMARLRSVYSIENRNRASKGGEKLRYAETNKMRALSDKRNRRMEAYYHSATNAVVRKLQWAGVDTLVIGYNKGIKTSSKMSKDSNHKFIPIPHKKILNELERKCIENNINVVWTEESYTSKASFLDGDDIPVYGDGAIKSFNGVRKTRSLYRSSDGTWIHADLNAAFNIIKKIAPTFSKDDVGDGCGVTQVRRLIVS